MHVLDPRAIVAFITRCRREVEMFAVATFVFVVIVLAVVAYALVRPFTHLGYRHPEGRL